jgi:hypothetical protein
MVCHPALLSGLIALALATPAKAEVTRFEVLERTASALQGRGFGAAGQVEKITASATIALDPPIPATPSSPISTGRRAVPTARWRPPAMSLFSVLPIRTASCCSKSQTVGVG